MSKVTVDYTIVTAAIVIGLSMEVQLRLLKGWQPIGGVSFDGQRYLQAMVKYKEGEE